VRARRTAISEPQAKDLFREIKDAAFQKFMRVTMLAGPPLELEVKRLERRLQNRTINFGDVRRFLRTLEPSLESPLTYRILTWILNQAEDALHNFLDALGIQRNPDAPLNLGTLFRLCKRQAKDWCSKRPLFVQWVGLMIDPGSRGNDLQNILVEILRNSPKKANV